MFRFRQRDLNSRCYDAIRKTCVLEDQGGHLIALALLRDTIEKVNSEIATESSKTGGDRDGANPADASISSILEAKAVKRGLKVVESATKRERFDAASKTDSSSAMSVVSAAAVRRTRRQQEQNASAGDGSAVDVDDADEMNNNNDYSSFSVGGTAEFEKFRARQEAEELYQSAVQFAMENNVLGSRKDGGSSSSNVLTKLSDNDLKALVGVL